MPIIGYAWGFNDGGQLGDATKISRKTPVQIKGAFGIDSLGDIKALSASHQSLALRSNGAVFGWGHNEKGQIGDETNTNRTTPVLVKGVKGDDNEFVLTNIKSISAGRLSFKVTSHSLALGSDGKVFAWGDNEKGQLGDDTNTSSTTPVKVLAENGDDLLSDIIEVSAGSESSVALRWDGTVFTWGDNKYGQLGDNSTISRRTPIKVPGLSDIKAISASYSVLALSADGVVFAWGLNISGQLGDNSTTSRNTPVQVVGVNNMGVLDKIVAVSTADTHSLALRSDGTVFAWGQNDDGQLGNGTKTPSKTPIQVKGLNDIVAVSAGYSGGCALRSDGVLFTWGDNSSGQLGNGTLTASTTPVKVPNLPPVLAMSMGNMYILALV